MATATRTPARDRATRFLPQAITEGWTIARFQREAGIGKDTATKLLREASRKNSQAIGSELDRESNRAVAVARQVRDGQIERANRVEKLADKALDALEAKAKKGELSLRDLETLVKLREKHWQHVKDLSGLALAEKLHIAKAKGDATGRGFAGALLDLTTLDIGDGVFEVAMDT